MASPASSVVQRARVDAQAAHVPVATVLDNQAAAAARQDQLTKPPGSLGRLEEIAEWLACWQGRSQPRVERPRIAVFAGMLGVTVFGLVLTPVFYVALRKLAGGGRPVSHHGSTMDGEAHGQTSGDTHA